jgi:hypothetical protein
MKKVRSKKGALLTAVMLSLLLPTCMGHAATQVSFTNGIDLIGLGETLLESNPYLVNGITDTEGINYTFSEN